jgi:hypothetical protein
LSPGVWNRCGGAVGLVALLYVYIFEMREYYFQLFGLFRRDVGLSDYFKDDRRSVLILFGFFTLSGAKSALLR